MLVQLLVFLSDQGSRHRAARLEGPGLRVEFAERVDDLSGLLARVSPDVLLVDGRGLGADPAERVTAHRARKPAPAIIYVAAGEGPDERARLLAAGCLAIVERDAGEREFCEAVRGVVDRWRQARLGSLEAGRRTELRLGDFVTASPAMQRFMETARRVSAADTSVLVLGETGVGKERLASAIHAAGRRRDHPMVVVNCGAIPETLLESELFGHERGSFTGAERTHRGHFELAHSGTVFLDEIGEMPLHLQVKLLRVLQEREIRRVGGEKPIPVDVRVIAATNRNLEEEVAGRRFRPDLFYRLSVVTLTIPPLRERHEDISLLVQEYLARFCVELGVNISGVAEEAMRALMAYHWPGNVRELVNVVERAVLLCNSETITLDDLPDGIVACSLPQELARLADQAAEPVARLDPAWFRLPLRDARHAWNAAFEKLHLQHALRESRGRIGAAAASLGVDPRSLYAKMKYHGLNKEDFRQSAPDH